MYVYNSHSNFSRVVEINESSIFPQNFNNKMYQLIFQDNWKQMVEEKKSNKKDFIPQMQLQGLDY